MEVVTLHVGQAGVAAAAPMWQLYCIEHDLEPDGSKSYNPYSSRATGYHSFFVEMGERASPRAVLIDMDSSSIDNVLQNAGRHLFSRENTVTSLGDAGSNYAKARYSQNGKAIVAATMSKLRRMSEGFSSLQGFIVQHGLGGGTGSGVVANLLDKLYYAFPKKPVLQFAIFPSSKLSVSVLEPYNTILGTAATKPGHKCCCLASNSGMYRALGKNNVSTSTDYRDINVLWDYAIGTVTANLRHGGELNAKLRDITTNLVPYPSLRFPFMSYCPVKYTTNNSVKEIVRMCFEERSQLLTCDVTKGNYLAATVLLRGKTSPQEVAETLISIRGSDQLNFAPWCPNGFKIGMCPRSSGVIPNSILTPSSVNACGLHATSAIGHVWSELQSNYRVMLRKKAFIHWYLAEGMEEDEFQRADNEITDMVERYKTSAT